MTDSELLNCPFCGASAEVTNRLNLKWARCSYFDCFMHSHEVMPEMWNRRSAPPGEGQSDLLLVPKAQIDKVEQCRLNLHVIAETAERNGHHAIANAIRMDTPELWNVTHKRYAAPSHHSGTVVDQRLEIIANIIQGWLDWQEERDGKNLPDDHHVMSVSSWPSRGQLKHWINALRHPSSTGAEDNEEWKRTNRCGACNRGIHKECSGWCFCSCDEGRIEMLPISDDKKAQLKEAIERIASPPSASAQGWVACEAPTFPRSLTDPYQWTYCQRLTDGAWFKLYVPALPYPLTTQEKAP